jgi:hypothetical protein
VSAAGYTKVRKKGSCSLKERGWGWVGSSIVDEKNGVYKINKITMIIY